MPLSRPLENSFSRKLDTAKNRFKLPFDWIGILSEVGRLFATIMNDELVFFLPEVWQEVSQSLISSRRPEDIQSYNLACEVNIQKNGKISIPKKLAMKLPLGERVELKGQGDRFVVQPAGRPIQADFDLFAPPRIDSLGIYQIPVESIEFDERRAESVEAMPEPEVGDVFPPVLVTNTDVGKYALIWGLKHLLAQRKLGRKSIAAIVLEQAPTEEPVWFALEQLSRVPDSQMVGLVELMRNRGIKPSMIAKILDRTVRTVQRYLVVARAPEHIRTAFEEGELSLSLAYEAAKKGISPVELRGKTFKKAKEMIHERGLAKAPCNIKGGPVKKEIHPNGDVNLVLSFRVGRDRPEHVIEELKRVVEHLNRVKGVGHGTERGKRG